jgi:squalene synthase HpnC
MSQAFAVELTRFGPDSKHESFNLTGAQLYCSRLAQTHYENFTVASWLLPRRLRQHFYNVYAYCRWADDLADESGNDAQALGLLSWWKQELIGCYEGKPQHPVMVALSDTIHQFHIPRDPFLDLLIAFEQDQRVKRYQSYQELLDYCRYSANPVGHLVLYLCESYDQENAALSDSICTGLQLANFWQDVARDFDIGRVYLPEEDRRRFGYSDDDLNLRRFTPAFAELMRFEVERTRDLFHRGRSLVERVPPDVRLDIDLFIQGGLAILRMIEGIKYNVWQTRPKLSKVDKARLLATALARRWLRFNFPRSLCTLCG